MAMTSAQISLSIAAALSDDSGSYSPGIRQALNLAIGTAASQVDLIYSKKRTIVNAATPDSIDLTGVLVGPAGDAVNFVELTTYCFVNMSAAQILTIGAGSNPFVGHLGGTAPTIKVGKSGIAFGHNIVDGWPVTAATGDLIQVVTDGGANIEYLVMLLGRSA